MAILWSKFRQGVQYEVRNAGASIRLYSNGVLHSEYNPRKLITKSVWDMLFVPMLHRPLGSIKKVAVLGLGGGAVVHMIRVAMPNTHVTAVELDSVHIQACKKFFNLDDVRIDYVHSDAREWLKNTTLKYDVIIDDLFGHHEGEARRAIDVDLKWVTLIKRKLLSSGIYIANFGDSNELRSSSRRLKNSRLGFACARRYYADNCQNIIVAASSEQLVMNLLKINLVAISQTDKRFANMEYRSVKV